MPPLRCADTRLHFFLVVPTRLRSVSAVVHIGQRTIREATYRSDEGRLVRVRQELRKVLVNPDLWDFTEHLPGSLDEISQHPVGTGVQFVVILSVPFSLANVPRNPEVIEQNVNVKDVFLT